MCCTTLTFSPKRQVSCHLSHHHHRKKVQTSWCTMTQEEKHRRPYTLLTAVITDYKHSSSAQRPRQNWHCLKNNNKDILAVFLNNQRRVFEGVGAHHLAQISKVVLGSSSISIILPPLYQLINEHSRNNLSL